MTPPRLRRYFLRGLAISAPILLTLAVLIWVASIVESTLGNLIKLILPEGYYVPGMGLILGLLILLLSGMLANLLLFRRLVAFAEKKLDRIPIVKTLYKGMKDISGLLSKRQNGERGKTVAVDLGGFRLIGFMMRSQSALCNALQENEPLVAVYLPMSYQIGGYILYLPANQVKPLDVSAEDAMRAILTGGELEVPSRQASQNAAPPMVPETDPIDRPIPGTVSAEGWSA